MGHTCFSHIREVYVIDLVLRDFSDENVIRSGSVHPKSDREILLTELQLADLAQLERCTRPNKKLSREETTLYNAIDKIKKVLASGQNATKSELTKEEFLAVKSFGLLTLKPMITVLNVDDETVTLEILEGHLIREGYNIVFASHGFEALAQVEETPPDVILLAVMMPDMDGFEVCRRLKANKRWRHIPVILVTALADKTDMARGLDAGADDFVNKPVHTVELRARVRSMLRIKNQYDALQSTLRLREDMAHMIAHDMRTPLNVISGYCEWILARNTTPAKNLEDLEKIRHQAEYLNGFLNDMLIMAKMEADRLIVNPTPVNIGQIIDRVTESHILTAQSKNINLVVDLPDEAPTISLDANLFPRVLDNLVSNALKFSPDGSTVTLQVTYPKAANSSQTEEPKLCVQVLDEEPGVPEAHRAGIFRRF